VCEHEHLAGLLVVSSFSCAAIRPHFLILMFVHKCVIGVILSPGNCVYMGVISFAKLLPVLAAGIIFTSKCKPPSVNRCITDLVRQFFKGE